MAAIAKGPFVFDNGMAGYGGSRRLDVLPTTHVNGGLWPGTVKRWMARLSSLNWELNAETRPGRPPSRVARDGCWVSDRYRWS